MQFFPFCQKILFFFQKFLLSAPDFDFWIPAPCSAASLVHMQSSCLQKRKVEDSFLPETDVSSKKNPKLSEPQQLCKEQLRNILENKEAAPEKLAKDLPEVVPEYWNQNYLAANHSHPNDKRIIFIEDGHLYYVAWYSHLNRNNYTRTGTTSVSTFVHEWFPHFNAVEIISKMRRGRNFHKKTEYAGMNDQQIMDKWEANGQLCSSQGSKFHYLLECFYNGMVQPLRTGCYSDFRVIKMFLRWHDSAIRGKLEPFRTEMQLMSDSELRLTGTIDILFIQKNHPPPEETGGTLFLVMKDWKFSKAIKRENRWDSGLRGGPCEKFPNCNFIHYSLQLNTYQYLIENTDVYSHPWVYRMQKFDRVKIVSKALVVFHDNQEEAEEIPVLEMGDVVREMVVLRKKKLQNEISPEKDKEGEIPAELLQKTNIK